MGHPIQSLSVPSVGTSILPPPFRGRHWTLVSDGGIVVYSRTCAVGSRGLRISLPVNWMIYLLLITLVLNWTQYYSSYYVVQDVWRVKSCVGTYSVQHLISEPCGHLWCPHYLFTVDTPVVHCYTLFTYMSLYIFIYYMYILLVPSNIIIIVTVTPPLPSISHDFINWKEFLHMDQSPSKILWQRLIRSRHCSIEEDETTMYKITWSYFMPCVRWGITGSIHPLMLNPSVDRLWYSVAQIYSRYRLIHPSNPIEMLFVFHLLLTATQ